MRVLWIAVVVVGLDQVTKWLVLRLMHRHQSIPLIGDWLRFTFTENPGMAFGIQFGPPGTVAVLSVLATGLVIYYLVQVNNLYWPYRASLALILGGAIGNIIDRVFYGVWLGYGELFTGRVVDFIHVSLWQGLVPPGVPLIGGSYMELFPIWNVADMAIVIGVVGVLVFHNAFYEDMIAREHENDEPEANRTMHQDVQVDGLADASSSNASTTQMRRSTQTPDPASAPPSEDNDASSSSSR